MNRHRMARGLAGTSLLLAVAALIFLAFWPWAYQGSELSANGEVIRNTSASLIEENGAGILVWLFFPAILSLIGFLGSFRQAGASRLAMWAAAILLLMFALATGFSIGMFYLPSALALMVAAATAKGTRPSTDSAQTSRVPQPPGREGSGA